MEKKGDTQNFLECDVTNKISKWHFTKEFLAILANIFSSFNMLEFQTTKVT